MTDAQTINLSPSTHPRLSQWADARRVLLIRLDNMGDVLMTTPAFAALRRALPKARITLLTSPSGAALAPHLGMVDEVVSYLAPWMKGSAGRTALLAAANEDIVARLRVRRHDAAVIFTTASQSSLPAALVCWQAGIGLRLAHCRENPYDLLSDWVPDQEVVQTGMRHEVQRQLDMLTALGIDAPLSRMVFDLREADHAGAAARLRRAGLPAGGPYVLLHPGATAPSRRYPAGLFGEAMGEVMQRTGLPCVFVGAESEAGLVHEAHAAAGGQGLALVGDLSLGELGAMIKGASVLVCNNSGPAHMASALGTPVVDLYALTNPQHTPWQVPSRVLSHDVPCRNCLRSVCPQGHHACLLGVPPVLVAEAALDLLGELVDAPSRSCA